MGSIKVDKSKYTEDYIQRRLTFGFMTHPKYIVYNLYVFGWESDFLFCTQSGYWYEIEIKVSLSDFKNDFKKEKYRLLETDKALRPNYFAYCVPYYLVDSVKALVPKGYGLYYITNYGQVKNDIIPKRIHNLKIPDDKLRLTEKFYYAYHNWRSKSLGWRNKERKLKAEISWLRAEYKSATGYDINESL